MNLIQLNEIYREMLENGAFVIIPGKAIRLIRVQSSSDFEYCPITAIAKFKKDESWFLNDYSDAGESLELSHDLVNFIVEIADRMDDTSYLEYLHLAASNSLFPFTYDPNEFPD